MIEQLRPLRDDDARRRALTEHARSQLVEAGAGSGKTAVMAGRVAMMLADGIEPKHIAAVTFYTVQPGARDQGRHGATDPRRRADTAIVAQRTGHPRPLPIPAPTDTRIAPAAATDPSDGLSQGVG